MSTPVQELATTSTHLDQAAFALWLEAQGERRFPWTGFGSCSHPIARYLRETTGRPWAINQQGVFVHGPDRADGEPNAYHPESLPAWALCFADWYDDAGEDSPTARECLDVLRSFHEPRAPRRVEGEVRRFAR